MRGCKIRLLVHDVRNGIGVNHANDETEWVRKYAVGVAGARSKSRRAGAGAHECAATVTQMLAEGIRPADRAAGDRSCCVSGADGTVLSVDLLFRTYKKS